MLDLALGALLVGLGIRGWMRGLVREVISLAVLIVGTVAAFRLSTPLGRVLANMSGASPDVARYVAGIVIFVALSIAAAIVVRVLHVGIRILPGVSTLNRAAGAVLSLIALTLVVTLAVSVATVLDLPDGVERQIEESTVATALTDPYGAPQRVLGFLSGDRVVEISLRIRSLTGADQAVATAGAPLEFPQTDSSRLERLPAAEESVLTLLNRERVAADVDPLPRAAGLDLVAFNMAMEGYASGYVAVLEGEALRAVLNDAGMPGINAAQVVVLAAGPESAHAALADHQKPKLTGHGYTRVGIAVIKGPLGLLVIELFEG